MKHKVGDMVFVKAMVTDTMLDIDGGIERYMFECSDFWSQEDDIIEPTAPVVWRDGAVELPNEGEEVYYIRKEHCKAGSSWIAYTHIASYDLNYYDVYWIYASELPMPLVPHLRIDPCPVCGNDNFYCMPGEYGISLRCGNDNCPYSTKPYRNESIAIEKHNYSIQKMKSS